MNDMKQTKIFVSNIISSIQTQSFQMNITIRKPLPSIYTKPDSATHSFGIFILAKCLLYDLTTF
jgi:hypothetical protein